ncbi:DUF3299 domain-containing protein [Nitratireductor kimnyeongensis]|uniref:DUF3299 domain-containing protein n=1 Tax=Nitratireductor kimnyeongensis TaxID=430679 RepID=A0ABW0TB45_9HYPH|nr:DUF3299 domain-containing protein [Nitratireductor kimnyeongensis]QZZ35717.1 DUF3299 domain-containing protein [Nitratireductor kimnyeongensis]
MTRRCAACLAAALAALPASVCSTSTANGSGIPEHSEGVPLITWSDLASPAPVEKRNTRSADLRGQTVSLSGFLLAADLEGELVYSFILVARRGACSHMQQPSPDQVVRVVPSTPYRLSSNYEPVTITGSLQSGHEKTQLFILDGPAIIESAYTMRRATVTPNKSSPAQRTPFFGNPWHRVVNDDE